MRKIKIKKHTSYLVLGLILLIILISVAIYFYYSNRGVGVSVEEIVDTSKDKLIDSPRDYRSLQKDKLFVGPQSTASALVKKEYVELVDSYAVESSKIIIKDCKPDIEVLSVKKGEDLRIQNRDKANRTIIISSNKTVISPGQTAAINTNFSKGLGIYVYFCDDDKRPVGIIRTK